MAWIARLRGYPDYVVLTACDYLSFSSTHQTNCSLWVESGMDCSFTRISRLWLYWLRVIIRFLFDSSNKLQQVSRDCSFTWISRLWLAMCTDACNSFSLQTNCRRWVEVAWIACLCGYPDYGWQSILTTCGHPLSSLAIKETVAGVSLHQHMK